jgi:hypothetical protein
MTSNPPQRPSENAIALLPNPTHYDPQLPQPQLPQPQLPQLLQVAQLLQPPQLQQLVQLAQLVQFEQELQFVNGGATGDCAPRASEITRRSENSDSTAGEIAAKSSGTGTALVWIGGMNLT